MFTWTVVQQEALQTLKDELSFPPVLALLDFSKQFVIETDDKCVGAIMQQDGDPVAFVSTSLGVKSQGLSTYEMECLAMYLLFVGYLIYDTSTSSSKHIRKA
jgi:hypothetical protein